MSVSRTLCNSEEKRLICTRLAWYTCPHFDITALLAISTTACRSSFVYILQIPLRPNLTTPSDMNGARHANIESVVHSRIKVFTNLSMKITWTFFLPWFADPRDIILWWEAMMLVHINRWCHHYMWISAKSRRLQKRGVAWRWNHC